MVGCSGAGILADGVEIDDGPAVGVLAVATDAFRATPFLFHGGQDLGLTAGREAGARFNGSRDRGDLVLAWPDPAHVRPDRFLQGVGSALGGVPVAGGAAAGRDASSPVFLLCGSEVAEASVSGLRLSGRFRYRVAITQGCRPLTGPLVVTRAQGNLVLEIEGRPPLEVLAEVAPAGLLDRRDEAFDRLFVGLLPGGGSLPPAGGGYLVRSILTADDDTGVIGIAGEVEDGESILFASREGDSAREDLSRVLASVRAGDRVAWRFGLYFDCLARGRTLYGEPGVDAAILAEALPEVPILGFHCAAEMAPLGGTNHVHTYSGVLVLVGE